MDDEDYYNGEEVRRHASLLKEATALKKSDLTGAIAKIKLALNLLERYPISFRSSAIQKLATYQNLNKNHAVALDVLFKAYKEALSSDDTYMRVMEASIFVGSVHTLLKKTEIKNKQIECESMKLHIIALVIQGRMDQIESRCAVSISKDPNLKHFYEKNFKNWGNDKLLEDNLQSLLSSVTNDIDNLIADFKRQLIETS